MANSNERPVCHRAEDLVTYLYGEAEGSDTKDFAGHLQQCEACRSEFGAFQQVHDSILLWRNESLGADFNPAPLTLENRSAQLAPHPRRLSALAALREFFDVSPLWLRGATALATLLLGALAIVVISRPWNQPARTATIDSGKQYTKQQVDALVKEQVDQEVARLRATQTPAPINEPGQPSKSNVDAPRLAVNHSQPKASRPRGLSREEREQLAADLRLIPGRDEESLPFVFSDEPNQ